MDERVSSCVWSVTPKLIGALHQSFGAPTDSYVNGSQTWLRDNGPREATLEWRLHPIAGFQQPGDISPYELWELVTVQLHNSQFQLGKELRGLHELWDALEAFPAFGNEMEPVELRDACEETLGITPDLFGLVNHDAIADLWERAGGNISMRKLLLEEFNQ